MRRNSETKACRSASPFPVVDVIRLFVRNAGLAFLFSSLSQRASFSADISTPHLPLIASRNVADLIRELKAAARARVRAFAISKSIRVCNVECYKIIILCVFSLLL